MNSGFSADFFFDDLVVDLELLLQDRVRRLVELDVVLGLQLDVVLASSGRSPSTTCPAEAASTALAMIALIFSGSALYLSLLNMISNCSAFW